MAGRKMNKNSNKREAKVVKVPVPTPKGWPYNILLDIAQDRLCEARSLSQRRLHTGSAYIAGYVLEIQLKAEFSVKFCGGFLNIYNPPNPIRTHDLNKLLHLAQLEAAVRQMEYTKPGLFDNWMLARDWDPEYRYQRLPKAEASELFEAVSDKRCGVAQWLDFRVRNGVR